MRRARKLTLGLAALGLLIVGWTILQNANRASNAPGTDTQAAPGSPAFPALSAPAASTLQPVEPHPMAASFGALELDAGQEALILHELFEIYRREFGAFPTGEDNAQMLRALMGANPSRLPIFPTSHPRLNGDGALLDAWGTPFHFHSISSSHLEIISAGPDRELFTDDDILAGRKPARHHFP